MGIVERILRIVRAELADRFGSRSAQPSVDVDDEELRRIIEELNASHAQKQQRPPQVDGAVAWAYQTLGVSPSASNEEIKAAYRRAIRQVHPDRFARAPADQQRWAAQRAQEINRAYAILKAVRHL